MFYFINLQSIENFRVFFPSFFGDVICYQKGEILLLRFRNSFKQSKFIFKIRKKKKKKMYWFWGSSASSTPTAAVNPTPTSNPSPQNSNGVSVGKQALTPANSPASQSVISVPVMPPPTAQSPHGVEVDLHYSHRGADKRPSAVSILDPVQSTAAQHNNPQAQQGAHPQPLVALIDSLINYMPIPKLMEAAVLVGKAKLLLESSEEQRMLDQTRIVDEALEEAIQHRNERNRLLKVAAERDALVDVLKKHKLISFTPSLTEERTTKIEHIVAEIRNWLRARGGLALVLSSSASLCNDLRSVLLKGANQIELEIGTVFSPAPAPGAPPAAPSSSTALSHSTLSYILLSGLMVDISRVTLTALTTFITDGEPDDDLAQLLGNSTRQESGAGPDAHHRKIPSSPGLAFHGASNSTGGLAKGPNTSFGGGGRATSASSHQNTAAALPPARANKQFFRDTARGQQIAQSFRQLIVIAKTTATSGNVVEEVQTVASFKLAEIMSALDDTIPMEGVGRSKGDRARSPSTTTNGSFSANPATGTPLSSGGETNTTAQVSKAPPTSSICCLTGMMIHSTDVLQDEQQKELDREPLLATIRSGSGVAIHPFAAAYLLGIIRAP